MATVNLTAFTHLVALDAVGVSQPLLEMYTRFSLIEFCKQSQILEKDCSFTITTANIDPAINNFYDVDLSDVLSDERISDIDYLAIDSNVWDVHYKDIVVNIPNFDSYKASQTKYFSFPDDSTLRFYDIRDTESEMYLRLIVVPQLVATGFDDKLYYDWVEIITAGAKAKLQAMPSKNWTDYDAATYNNMLFRKGVSQARACKARGYVNKNLSVQPKEFI